MNTELIVLYADMGRHRLSICSKHRLRPSGGSVPLPQGLLRVEKVQNRYDSLYGVNNLVGGDVCNMGNCCSFASVALLVSDCKRGGLRSGYG